MNRNRIATAKVMGATFTSFTALKGYARFSTVNAAQNFANLLAGQMCTVQTTPQNGLGYMVDWSDAPRYANLTHVR